MRKSILAAIGLALSGLQGVASAEPAMWTMSDDDTTINIIGTVHLLPPDTEWQTERIIDAFEAADTVCFELDAVGRALEVTGLSFRRGLMPSGERLTDYLNKDEISDLKELAAELGIPFPSLNVMQPWFAGLTVEQYIAAKAGFAEGVEFTLYLEVLSEGKNLCELETVEEQLGGLSGLSLKEQFAFMRASQAEYEDLKVEDLVSEYVAEFDNMVADWLAGDVEAIGEIVTVEEFGSEAYYNALLLDRNKNWIPRIEALLEGEGNIFIAVGAAHLAGPDSVIKMLRDKGYAIEGP
ncbi:MAG: TraB/GumN family protein [Pseudomonadota bacterium]